MSSEGDKYVDLGKKKRATVRSFKGKAFIDIREFYGDDGNEKPGTVSSCSSKQCAELAIPQARRVFLCLLNSGRY
jgi:hypothetical protein